jgi:hypothetical protein
MRLVAVAAMLCTLSIAVPKCTAAQGTAAVSSLAPGGAQLVVCIAGDLAKGRDTFEDLAADCGAATLSEVIGVVETLAATAPDAAPAASASTPALAAKVHHRNSGK